MTSHDLLRWRVGELTITRVEENVIPIEPGSLVPGITAEHLERHGDWLGPYFDHKGRLRLSLHSFVVQHGELTILIDTCVGSAEPRPLPGDDQFIDRLGDVVGGLESVDIVVCTHLHFDHVGWNTIERDGEIVPTFPNARYLITDAELDHLEVDDHNNVGPTSVMPLVDAGVVERVSADHEITPAVRLVSTPGHSPGHVSVLIESGGQQALITGDAFHTPLQFAHPELAATPFDFDSDASTTTRRRLIDELLDQDTLVLGTHFAPPTGGHVRSGSDGVRFT